jgi:hypothetical protein
MISPSEIIRAQVRNRLSGQTGATAPSLYLDMFILAFAGAKVQPRLWSDIKLLLN